MASDNKQTTRRLIEDVWNGGKLEVIDELLDPDFEGHDPLMGKQTRDIYRRGVKGYRAAFPDLKFEANQLLLDGNYVITRWTARGTHLGPFLGTESTGKTGVVTGINVAEFRNGKVIWQQSEWDALGLFRQLGLEDVTVPLAARQPRPQQARP